MVMSFQPFNVIEPWVFETITPSQFITFTMPNPLNHRRLLHALVIRVAVLDSPIATADDEVPLIAAMIVPNHRETDWNFCTESGHLQLLYDSHNVSRLILIGNNPPPNPEPSIYIRPQVTGPLEKQRLENELKPLLMALHPKGLLLVNFVVEDVELEGNRDRSKMLRRRLRFKRMPNLIQSQVPLIHVIGDDEATTQVDLESLRKIVNAKFDVDTTVLVHPYLPPMVAGLFLIASHLNERIQQGFTPRALCLGIGGGVLLSFLKTQLGFDVIGVEADKVVLTAATKHFGFNKSGSIRLIVGDAIEVIQNFPSQKIKGDIDGSKVNNDVLDTKFDVAMVDLDSNEAQNGISAPPPEFVKKPVFKAARSLLDDHGVLIINVVPLNELFYTTLVKDLKDTFIRFME
ncbi:unnamed protein product [Lactuca virosa]|uniref:Methyltransferase-like protein 13 n=1 Tax=Lactuca virosa TaxID=75947 RepID=A0AAU9NCL9_9ASTR|nr:unnamed protein product [Lactuca virosa]